MRLINVETMKIEQFFGDDVPSYLILSHTWTAEEISFQDYVWLLNHQEEVAEGIIDELTPKQRARVLAKAEALRQRSGYKKIQDFTSRAHELRKKHGCPATHNQAKAGGLYVWVDTCCINKESSAELSEAINSMYTWYANALLCVAVLTDVAGTESDPNGEFGDSRWFTRGWTLQELVAPFAVVFYNSSYELIGSRSDLARSIARITSIDQKYLHSPTLGRTSASPTIAERMSWAAGRQTTRLEDEAYCLLGIFGVNMPLLYGEGANAFVRLQQEIIKSTEDQTIFAWGYNMSRLDKGILSSRLIIIYISLVDNWALDQQLAHSANWGKSFDIIRVRDPQAGSQTEINVYELKDRFR
ncbi:HET-domain-containing protein [Coniochaeta sp. PMI_546]|nr:HET-domain-containing protein [Coniochaeta sp. PMI_546]